MAADATPVGFVASLPLISMPGPSGSSAVPAEWAEAASQGAWFVVAAALFMEAGRRRDEERGSALAYHRESADSRPR